ncbi:MarR family winged helix-turn-helix transcriptional regulator [Phytoactinopolyspora halophila]|uniref:MarR family winged helix-turn-helix transcriptional regulator n=1 Tax=Phytoactinopolyspora halophila TaxID=1981511 RepID=UPI0013144B3E|nr:MarR family winged helix-turn-helix transcriptional regulator [Phytoactinopolyspora halophila]
MDRLLIEVRDPALDEAGIGREQWQILRMLADGEGHAMGEVSDMFGLPGATATRLVDSLAQRMLVYRRHDELDRRRVLIYLAEPGRTMLDHVQSSMLGRADALLAGIDPGERAELVRLLGRAVSTSDQPAHQE